MWFCFFLQRPQTSSSSGVPVCAGRASGGHWRELQAEHEREAGALHQAVSAGEEGVQPTRRAPGEEEAEGSSVPNSAYHRGGGEPGKKKNQVNKI